MPSEPICVRRAATIEEAEIIVAWLDERGVMATIFDPSNPGVAAFGVTDLEGPTSAEPQYSRCGFRRTRV